MKKIIPILIVFSSLVTLKAEEKTGKVAVTSTNSVSVVVQKVAESEFTSDTVSRKVISRVVPMITKTKSPAWNGSGLVLAKWEF